MEKETLKVCMIQTVLHWENQEKNLAHFETIFRSLPSTDLVVLPEMFTTGFSMNCSLADQNSSTLLWMQSMSKQFNFAIIGSSMTEDKGRFYNRLHFVEPSGKFYVYNKKHLFSIAGEDKYYSAGEERLIVDYYGWKICPMVCYDLRFPGWSRNQELTESTINPVFDLLIYVANWPQKRATAWTTLIAARAIENYAYCIGVNRVGEDGNQIPHSGNSAAIDPTGSILVETSNGKDEILCIELDKIYLEKFREQFPAWKDADNLLLQ
jgi:omega-amidase